LFHFLDELLGAPLGVTAASPRLGGVCIGENIPGQVCEDLVELGLSVAGASGGKKRQVAKFRGEVKGSNVADTVNGLCKRLSVSW
jgi:hypothetical protein